MGHDASLQDSLLCQTQNLSDGKSLPSDPDEDYGGCSAFMYQVIQAMAFFIPELEVTNNNWKGHLYNHPKKGHKELPGK